MSIVISFSIKFRAILNIRDSGPRAVSISRRVLMSVVLNDRVSMAATR